MKIFFFVLYCSLARVFSQNKLSQIDNFRYEFLVLQKDLWDFVDNYVDDLITVITPELDLINKIKKFGDQLQEEFPKDFWYELKAVENVDIWTKTCSELKQIYGLYKKFRRFQESQTTSDSIPSSKQKWIDMTETILQSGKFSIERAQKSITEFIVDENLYNEVLKNAKGDILCKVGESPHQILYRLYNTIELTKLKGYIMMQFSYMLLKLYGKGNFSKEAKNMNCRYKESTTKSVEYVKKAMEKSSRQFWKCDPEKHILNETYIEVTQLLQGYIQNEVDLNHKESCSQDCSFYTFTKSYNCYHNLYCNQQRRCNGNILNCKYIHKDMSVCPSSSIGRRYEYIEYENGRVLGKKQECASNTVAVKSWSRYVFWECSYCFCLCDEHGFYSDRYINMRSVIADIENNRVVTGLRFVKKNRIIHLQIQEGELLPQGKINQSTIQWKQPEDYKITDRFIHNQQDYYTLSWKQRSIDLDDLITDDGYILTGVRFHKIGTHLNFEIYMSPFNFSSGTLNQPLETSNWKYNKNTDVTAKNPRTQLHLSSPGIPTLSISSIPDSKSDQYIEMSHTDFDKDAAQTTVPFFDAQPVVPSEPVPLSGAGIYHKHASGSGGFIGVKVITYDFLPHLNAVFPNGDLKVN